MSERPARPIYVSLTDAADYLSVSVKTVRRMIADGTIPGYRLGAKSLRVKLDDLDTAGRRVPTAGWWPGVP